MTQRVQRFDIAVNDRRKRAPQCLPPTTNPFCLRIHLYRQGCTSVTAKRDKIDQILNANKETLPNVVGGGSFGPYMIKFFIFGLIIFFVMCFVAVAVMYPELVGIAGKKAREIEGSHTEDEDQPTNEAKVTSSQNPPDQDSTDK